VQLGDLASALALELEGDASLEIEGLAGLEDASPSELSFVAGPAYAKVLRSSRAGAVLAPPGLAVDRPCLRSPVPYADFGRAVPLFLPRPRQPMGVDATASIAEDAVLGQDVSVGAYAVVGPGCRIGPGSTLHPHVVLYPGVVVGRDCELHSAVQLRTGVRLGDRVRLQNGVVVGADGFGFAIDARGQRVRIPHHCGVEIEDDVEVGANSTIDAAHPGHARWGHARACTRIESGAKIDNLVQVGHGCIVGRGSVLCAQVGLAGSTVLGRDVYMAGQAAAKGHIRIGDGSLIGGATAVTASVPPGTQLLGVPPGMERRRWGRIVAAWKRLPELFVRVRRLERQLGGGDAETGSADDSEAPSVPRSRGTGSSR